MPNVTYGAAYKDTTARKDTIVKIDPAYKGDIWGHKKAIETSADAQKKTDSYTKAFTKCWSHWSLIINICGVGKSTTILPSFFNDHTIFHIPYDIDASIDMFEG
jgi:hypothetical protein